MTLTEKIREDLLSLRDEGYRAFFLPLIPGVDEERVIGVRIPVLRAMAKKLFKSGEYAVFCDTLPHIYYEENTLHALIINEITDFSECIGALDKFLPHVDNWGCCDSIRPKNFSKNKGKLITEIERYLCSEHTYTVRFAIEMLMVHFMGEDFDEGYLRTVSKIQTDEYYLKMMIAWYFATALTKQYEKALPYIEERRLSPWCHNKAIRKACESLCIPKERKEYLKTLVIKKK